MAASQSLVFNKALWSYSVNRVMCPERWLMACKEDTIFIIFKSSSMEQSNNHCSAGTNHEYILFLGDCRFVSATFRLFKLPQTGPSQKCQVIYNGGIRGHEKELIFDANFTFKVTKDFHDFQHSSSSYFCSTNLFLILHCFSLFWSWYMCMCLCVCLYTHTQTHTHTCGLPWWLSGKNLPAT